MSVRIIYLERSDRGATIRRVRLVGQTTEHFWPAAKNERGEAGAGGENSNVDAGAAAAWVKEQLSQTRSTTSISMLCMDVDGSAMSWLTSPSADPAVINVLARYGGGPGGLAPSDQNEGPRGASAVDFYAPDVLDSSIQAVAEAQESESGGGGRSRRKSRAATADVAARRLPIIAMTDVPGRLLIDSLDDLEVPVESAASFWHACALAWDPAWSPEAPAAKENDAGPIRAEVAAPVSGTIVIDPRGKLIWCWSKGSSLLVGGSMRLRVLAPVAAAAVGAENTTEEERQAQVVFGHDEVTRLATEWLSWSAQTGHAPARMTCVMPDGDPGMVAEFGQALTRAWPGAVIDAAMAPDPIGATLRRVAERLEQTPASGAPLSPSGALVALSTRHGREHRKLYTWGALAVAAVALMLLLTIFKMQSMTSQAHEMIADTAAASLALKNENFPDVKVGPGFSLVKATSDEVARLRAQAEPAKRPEPPLPIMEELETISMVVGNPQYALDSLDLEASSSATLHVTIIADSFDDVDAMTKALNSIGNSSVSAWREPDKIDTKSRPGKWFVNYSGRWLARNDKATAPAPPNTPH